MLNKYKTKNYEYLLICDELPQADENHLLVEENAKLEDNLDLPIFEQYGFERDKKLFVEGICSFNDLKHAYFLIKTKELQKSASIRKLVLAKYESLSEYFNE